MKSGNMRLPRLFVRALLVLLISGIGSVAVAEGNAEAFKEGVNYLPIKPPLVVNYGGTGRVRYIKAEISLRTEDMKSAEEVSHHMPLIRDTLIMFLSGLTEEQLGSGEGKEKMRIEALAKINEALEKVEHPAGEQKPAEKPKDDHHAKDDKSKEKDEKDIKAKEEHKGPPVSDMLFDNLVVQK